MLLRSFSCASMPWRLDFLLNDHAGLCRAMKVLNPNKWWMIRGNHETREVNGNIEHYQQGSFLSQCMQTFGDHDGHIVWEAVNTFFDTLPLAATIDNTIFAVHGGIPRELCAVDASLDLIRRVEVPLRSAQNNQMVYDMLWSDPSTPEQENGTDLDSIGFGLSPRGCSCFGERSLDAFLNKYNFQHVFRVRPSASLFSSCIPEEVQLQYVFRVRLTASFSSVL